MSSNLDIYAMKRLKWRNSFSYSYNGSLPADFKKTSVFWNAGVSYLCLKNRKGEIRFSAFDILKQNRNISRTVGDNYIEDSQANNLQQYFMLGFAWGFVGVRG